MQPQEDVVSEDVAERFKHRLPSPKGEGEDRLQVAPLIRPDEEVVPVHSRPRYPERAGPIDCASVPERRLTEDG